MTVQGTSRSPEAQGLRARYGPGLIGPQGVGQWYNRSTGSWPDDILRLHRGSLSVANLHKIFYKIVIFLTTVINEW